MASPEGRPIGPVVHARHVASAIILLAMAVFATWNEFHNGNWADVVVPLSPQYRADVSAALVFAAIWWAGGLGLLTGTTAGEWLGRLGAAALLALGAWFLWDNVAHGTGAALLGNPLLVVVPISALLMGPGIGILIVLRPRVRRATAGQPGGSKA